MTKSETPISGRLDPTVRLTALLRKILDDLGRSIEDLKGASKQSELPFLHVNNTDIELVSKYLDDLCFTNDGKRLHHEYLRLSNKCIDEWLASIANGGSQELQRDQLVELFGEFPITNGPNDPAEADRRVAILGLAVQFSDYLSGLISAVEPSNSSTTSDDETVRSEDLLEICKPSERKAYLSFKLAEAKTGRRLQDREAYNFLTEVDWSEHGTKELSDYKLPSFVTWVRQLRTARAATNERKYSPRTHK